MENRPFQPENIPAIRWYREKKHSPTDIARQSALFHDIVGKIMSQRKRAKDEDGAPRYRDRHGGRCPIGHALGEHYDEAFEYHSIAHEPLQAALRANGIDSRDLDVLDALRWVHDRHSTHVWEERFAYVGKELGLAA